MNEGIKRILLAIDHSQNKPKFSLIYTSKRTAFSQLKKRAKRSSVRILACQLITEHHSPKYVRCMGGHKKLSNIDLISHCVITELRHKINIHWYLSIRKCYRQKYNDYNYNQNYKISRNKVNE